VLSERPSNRDRAAPDHCNVRSSPFQISVRLLPLPVFCPVPAGWSSRVSRKPFACFNQNSLMSLEAAFAECRQKARPAGFQAP